MTGLVIFVAVCTGLWWASWAADRRARRDLEELHRLRRAAEAAARHDEEWR